MCVTLAVIAGCISNDIPYPVVVPNITSLAAPDADKVDIDFDSRVVTLHFQETVDLRNISISSVEFDTDVAVPSVELIGEHDLSQPLRFDLSAYGRDYRWSVVAERKIERYFTIEGQVGSSVIDAANRRVVANVKKGTFITDIEVTSLKLGPRDITTYSLELSQMRDFTDGLALDVTAFGLTETWSIFIEIAEKTVEIKNLNPWTYDAYVTSSGISGMENGFMYRLKGDTDWTMVDESDITSDGGTYLAHIENLQPETTYEVIAYCGEEKTEVMEFVTSAATQLPNSSFEYASKVTGNDYYKFYDPDCGVEDGKFMFWGSGNGEGPDGVSGSADLGITITFVDKDIKVDGKQSVCAQTSQMVGMLAAGNLFTGQFKELVGTKGGMVNFGRPWSTRPKALKLYCKYTTGQMDIINGMPAGVTLTKSDYDRAQVKFAIGTWNYRTYGGTADSPILVNTTDAKTFVDFYTDKNTIANGDLIIYHDGYAVNRGDKVSASTGGWIEYIIPLEYRDMDTMPTHIIISCAASQFGDYFSGCSSSKLWLDAFQLIY